MLDQYIEQVKKIFKPNSKVVVAMSGGVDSSLTAALIKRAGFETIGITLQLYKSENIAKGKTCCAGKDIQDAKNVAHAENFPHYVLDYTTLFKKQVIDDFVDTYSKGETPIPCGRCNQYIKFGHMLEFVESIDADYLVTGHYVEKDEQGNIMRSEDKFKDQSYFLALTTAQAFEKLQFPLAKIEKKIVKQMAAEIGLVTANKSESMDICFIPDGDYRAFLHKQRPEMFIKGKIADSDGNELGDHTGLANYTVGQRKNLNLSNGPWYVQKIDTNSNTVIVARHDQIKHAQFKVDETNLLVSPEYFKNNEILIQIRARIEPAIGRFDPSTNIVSFNTSQLAIAPGQICAFYDNNRLLGGSIIKHLL
jgi:tRNA-specific 2-thiouridylase